MVIQNVLYRQDLQKLISIYAQKSKDFLNKHCQLLVLQKQHDSEWSANINMKTKTSEHSATRVTSSALFSIHTAPTTDNSNVISHSFSFLVFAAIAICNLYNRSMFE